MGKLADKVNRNKLLLMGLGVLLLANFIFVNTSHWWGALLGVIVVGLHMGMTQGLLSAMIADEAPADLRGTAFALYYFCVGASAMTGNVVAGSLSDAFGIHGCFSGGAIFTSLAAIALLLVIRYSPSLASPTAMHKAD
jgi:MFS family permease